MAACITDLVVNNDMNLFVVTVVATWHVYVVLYIFIYLSQKAAVFYWVIVSPDRINSIYLMYRGVFEIMWHVWSCLNGSGPVGRFSDTDLFPLLWRCCTSLCSQRGQVSVLKCNSILLSFRVCACNLLVSESVPGVQTRMLFLICKCRSWLWVEAHTPTHTE